MCIRDSINTIKASEHIRDKQVSSIDTEQALLAPARITQIVAYIREHFDQKTRRATFYRHKGKRLSLSLIHIYVANPSVC